MRKTALLLSLLALGGCGLGESLLDRAVDEAMAAVKREADSKGLDLDSFETTCESEFNPKTLKFLVLCEAELTD